MQTNANIPLDSALGARGTELMHAAHAYWKEYAKTFGSTAVVWLENDNGHFVLFTRGEYHADIMRVVPMVSREAPMVRPFDREPAYGEWIPGNKPLIIPPNTIKVCLVTVYEDYGTGEQPNVFEAFYALASDRNPEGWYTNGHHRDDLNVVAWMPKPKPYKRT